MLLTTTKVTLKDGPHQGLEVPLRRPHRMDELITIGIFRVPGAVVENEFKPLKGSVKAIYKVADQNTAAFVQSVPA